MKLVENKKYIPMETSYRKHLYKEYQKELAMTLIKLLNQKLTRFRRFKLRVKSKYLKFLMFINRP